MKNLIISITCLLILMIPWGFYYKYCDNTIEGYKNIISEQTIVSAESGNWQNAEISFNLIAKDWHKFKKISAYFIDTEALNDVNAHISKLSCYIKYQDTVNVVAESTELENKLDCLHRNELPSIGNIL